MCGKCVDERHLPVAEEDEVDGKKMRLLTVAALRSA